MKKFPIFHSFTASQLHSFTASQLHSFTASQLHSFTASQLHRQTKFLILVCLFLTTPFFNGILFAQHLDVPIEINVSSSSIGSMAPHLNGIGRNHTVGYATAYDGLCDFPSGNKDWYESKLEEKIEMFRGIDNNFSKGGNKLYRFGHNISDGNLDWRFESFAISNPGWHWATNYKRGADDEYYRLAKAGNLRPSALPNGVLGVPVLSPESELNLGAGVHRFFYTYRYDNGTPTPDKFSAFTVNVNYDYGNGRNSI